MRAIAAAFLLFCLSLSSPTYAYTECPFTPKKVWLQLNSAAPTTWICFINAACIYKTQGQDNSVTEAHIDRMHATALAAISAEKILRIRFPEDSADCGTILSASRNDILGFWLE